MSNQTNIHHLSGKAESFWISTVPQRKFEALPGDIDVDVAVVGGGIAGVTSAYLLKKAGLKVALIDARKILGGVTGYTTAKITSLHTLVYDSLISQFGKEKAKQYADANQASIEQIAQLTRENGIDCDLERKPSYTFAFQDKSIQAIEKEVDAAKSLGLPASFVNSIEEPFEIKGAIRFDNQAQFHPLKYLSALLNEIEGNGSRVYEQTVAQEIEDTNNPKVKTDRGTITAENIIVSTHYPFYDQPGLYFARCYQSRSYVVAFTAKRKLSNGMYISVEEPTRSLRSQPYGGKELIILTGNDHRTGHPEQDTLNYYKQLNEFADRYYKPTTVEYSWSTQDVMTLDHIPYVGKLAPGKDHIFIATGFRKWGMTNGTAAAMIIMDLITKGSNPWSEVFDPSRFKPITSIPELISQSTHIGEDLLAKRLVQPVIEAQQLKEDQADLATVNGKRVVAYKDPKGSIHAVKPSCTHMGCQVTWNHAELSWDCPCHGSRFNYDGSVIQEPATTPLKQIKE